MTVPTGATVLPERNHPSWLSPPQTLFFPQHTPAQLSHKSHWLWKHIWALLINVGAPPRCLSFTAPAEWANKDCGSYHLHLDVILGSKHNQESALFKKEKVNQHYLLATIRNRVLCNREETFTQRVFIRLIPDIQYTDGDKRYGVCKPHQVT